MIEHIVVSKRLQKRLRSKKIYPKDIKERFYECLQLLRDNEQHPSLRNKKVQGMPDCWEFSITMNYRCVYRRAGTTIYLLEFGKHEDIF